MQKSGMHENGNWNASKVNVCSYYSRMLTKDNISPSIFNHFLFNRSVTFPSICAEFRVISFVTGTKQGDLNRLRTAASIAIIFMTQARLIWWIYSNKLTYPGSPPPSCCTQFDFISTSFFLVWFIGV